MNGRRKICFVFEVALLKYVGKYGAALSSEHYSLIQLLCVGSSQVSI